jgi:hypothetical protein
MATLQAGGTATLSGLKLESQKCWRVSKAPARRKA